MGSIADASTATPANVLIFGTGGVGAIYAYILSRAGCHVTCVCRTNYDAVKANGILIRSAIFGTVSCRVTAVKSVEEAAAQHSASAFDFIIVCSKAFPGTSEKLKPAITSSTTCIVLAQNGIAIEDEYAQLYPHNDLISGVVYLPTTQVSPGIIEMGPLERFEIGTYPSTPTAAPSATSGLHQLSSLFTLGGATAPIFSDIQPQRWIKLAINSAWNPICALTTLDDANFIRSSPFALNLARDVMHEVSLVATAAGYPDIVTREIIDEHLARPKGRLETGGKEPSMLTDIRMGRGIEVEAILGNTVRLAREKGVETRCLEMLYVLAKGLDFAVRRPEGWRPILKVE